MNSVASFLKRARLFACLDDKEIDALRASARALELEQNQLLFSKGDDADAVFVILAGQIAIEIMSENGRAVRVATLDEGAVFGEFAAFDGGKRTADARSRGAASVLRIPKSAFVTIVEKNSKFARAMIADLIEKLRATNTQVENIALRPLKSQMVMQLIALGRQSGGVSPSLYITQSELAERLSATREKVNAHLQAIQRVGAIEVRRGSITIVDFDLLERLTDCD